MDPKKTSRPAPPPKPGTSQTSGEDRTPNAVNLRLELNSEGKLAPCAKPRVELFPEQVQKPLELHSEQKAAPHPNPRKVLSDDLLSKSRTSPIPKPRVKVPPPERHTHSDTQIVPFSKSRSKSTSDDHTLLVSKKLPQTPGRNGDMKPLESSSDNSPNDKRETTSTSASPPAESHVKEKFLDQSSTIQTVAQSQTVKVNCDGDSATLERNPEAQQKTIVSTNWQERSSSEESVEVSYTEPHHVFRDIAMTSNVAYLNNSAEPVRSTEDTANLPPIHSYDEPHTFWT